ncbi:hypothetical protein [Pseudomonas marginalis]|uniref:Uncharacterized protein n=1 Tax=Pseudomonas marginalis TaxID=298 RepID=A0A9X5QI40_PSEMA|nr:hypothetical protein [Pseudomonas marginalis]OAJ45716.1 hypothetical protein AO064_24550 [Pseudomonas marginalis]RMO64480.1 hypothetical protein ALQ38_04087 [Pseudomonas marginalis pv. marginalis]
MMGNSVLGRKAVECNALAVDGAFGARSDWPVSRQEVMQPVLKSNNVRVNNPIPDDIDPGRLISQLALLMNSLLSLLAQAKVQKDTDLSGDKTKHGTSVVPDKQAVVVPKNETISSISNTSAGKLPDDVWLGLSEGQGNNAGMIAGIKAAMMKFGQNPKGVFTRITENDGLYKVVMRDGFTVSLTRAEIDKARRWAGFSGEDMGMIKDATFMYAVAAKREEHDRAAHMKAGGGGIIQFSDDPFEAAMDSLNHYFWANKALNHLGLSQYVSKMPYAEAEAKGLCGVLTVGYEGMLMAKGYVDMYGPDKLSFEARKSEFGEGVSVYALI